MVEALSYHLRDRRVTLRLNEEVESVEETPDNGVVANLKSKKKVGGEALLYAVGRQGNVDELNLAAAGLEADSRGRIEVDAEYRTKQPHIFAVGDVIGFPSLGSVSMEQGRIAAAIAFGMPIHSDPAHYPYGIYTIPEISFIGKTEEQLTEAGCALRSRNRLLSRNRQGADSRRYDRAFETDFSTGHQGNSRRHM